MIIDKWEDSVVPVVSWCEDIEDGALVQAENLSMLPFAFKHVALMPDCHQGYGMPIGGVLATKGVVIPNAVGVDIGCGMIAVKTTLTNISTEELKLVLGLIRERIPVGFKKHSSPSGMTELPFVRNIYAYSIIHKEYLNAALSLGTLGGGNHFIEIQKGDDGYIWFMIHSGSRNLGKKVADYHNKIAKDLNNKYFSQVRPDWDLAFLPIESEKGENYLEDMLYCVDFALLNREAMAQVVEDIFREVFCTIGTVGIGFNEPINIAHNYARMENHFGRNVMVHRKGATSARDGEIGLIPGSQGTASYVVRGKGNRDSFNSCSHGAGRIMGRKQAERELNLAEEQKLLDDRGILHSIRGIKDLDEAPGAYKDIEAVMEQQKDLVDILVRLEPLGVVKG